MTDNATSQWVERAQASALTHKVYANAHTDTRTCLVRETPDDILRRTLPPTVGPDDAGMLTFDPATPGEDAPHVTREAGVARSSTLYVCVHCGGAGDRRYGGFPEPDGMSHGACYIEAGHDLGGEG